MAARAVDPETQRAQGYAVYLAHLDWVSRQVAAGVDGGVPEGRKVGSDYNLHVPDMEASPEAEEEYARAVRAALSKVPE